MSNEIDTMIDNYGLQIQSKASTSWLKNEEILCLLVLMQAYIPLVPNLGDRLCLLPFQEHQVPQLPASGGGLLYFTRIDDQDRLKDGINWRKKKGVGKACQVTTQPIFVHNVKISGVYSKRDEMNNYQRRHYRFHTKGLNDFWIIHYRLEPANSKISKQEWCVPETMKLLKFAEDFLQQQRAVIPISALPWNDRTALSFQASSSSSSFSSSSSSSSLSLSYQSSHTGSTSSAEIFCPEDISSYIGDIIFDFEMDEGMAPPSGVSLGEGSEGGGMKREYGRREQGLGGDNALSESPLSFLPLPQPQQFLKRARLNRDYSETILSSLNHLMDSSDWSPMGTTHEFEAVPATARSPSHDAEEGSANASFRSSSGEMDPQSLQLSVSDDPAERDVKRRMAEKIRVARHASVFLKRCQAPLAPTAPLKVVQSLVAQEPALTALKSPFPPFQPPSVQLASAKLASESDNSKSAGPATTAAAESTWLTDEQLSRISLEALERIFEQNIISVVQQLVQLSSAHDIDSLDHNGLNFLHYCSINDLNNLIRLLYDRGADLNKPSSHSTGLCTPLHMAAGSGNEEATKLLVHLKADVHALDGRGRKPLFYARISNQPVIVAFLEEQEKIQSPSSSSHSSSIGVGFRSLTLDPRSAEVGGEDTLSNKLLLEQFLSLSLHDKCALSRYADDAPPARSTEDGNFDVHSIISETHRKALQIAMSMMGDPERRKVDQEARRIQHNNVRDWLLRKNYTTLRDATTSSSLESSGADTLQAANKEFPSNEQQELRKQTMSSLVIQESLHRWGQIYDQINNDDWSSCL